MIQVVLKNCNTKTFGELEIGELFFPEESYEDGDINVFQKTIPVIEAGYPSDDELNGVLVFGDETGNIFHFDDNEKVIPICNGTFTVN